MKKAIITGASKGLGKAFAGELSDRDYEILLIARSENLLKDLAANLTAKNKQKIYYLPLDLSIPASIDTILNWCAQNNFHADVLINNAGFATWGYFDQLSLQKQRDMLQVNISAMVALTHGVVPNMKQNGHGFILNVCSTSAYQAVSTLTLYAASKSFVRLFSRGLRRELSGTGVSVTCLSPGPMATNFINEAHMDALKETAAKFEMNAVDVARSGLKAMFARRAEVIPGFNNALSVFLTKLVPDSIVEKIAEGIYKSKMQ